MPPMTIVADFYTPARKVTLIDFKNGESIWVEHALINDPLSAADQNAANTYGSQVITNPNAAGDPMEYIVVRNETTKRFTISVSGLNEGSDSTASRYCSGKCMPYNKVCAVGKSPGCDANNKLQCYPLKILVAKQKKQKRIARKAKKG